MFAADSSVGLIYLFNAILYYNTSGLGGFDCISKEEVIFIEIFEL